jgi:hypothetical protein
VVVHGVNLYHPYKIPNRWVRWCISVAVSEWSLYVGPLNSLSPNLDT